MIILVMIIFITVGFFIGFLVGEAATRSDMVNAAAEAMNINTRVSRKEALLDREMVQQKWATMIIDYIQRLEDDGK